MEQKAPEKIEFHSPAALPGVEILRVENSPRVWRWFHETYSVCTLSRVARTRWVYRGRGHEARQGELMLMEPGEVHDTKKLDGETADFQVALFSPGLVEKAAREMGLPSRPHLQLSHAASPALFGAFIGLHAAIQNGGSLLELQSRLATCLEWLSGELAEKAAARRSDAGLCPLRKARDAIISRSREDISLEELSEIAGLSRFHFLREFTRRFGLPPHAYQTQIRIAKARALLAKGVPAVQLDLGFSDQSHLIRHFKREMGVTPGLYADMVRRRTIVF